MPGMWYNQRVVAWGVDRNGDPRVGHIAWPESRLNSSENGSHYVYFGDGSFRVRNMNMVPVLDPDSVPFHL